MSLAKSRLATNCTYKLHQHSSSMKPSLLQNSIKARVRAAPCGELRIIGPAELELDAFTSSSGSMAVASREVAKVKLVTSPFSPTRMCATSGSPAGAASPLPRQVALWLGQPCFWHCLLQYLAARQRNICRPHD